VTAGKWGERNTEKRETRESRENRDRDTRETTTGGTSTANGDERKERPTAGKWQPSTRREGGETMDKKEPAAEGEAPKGAYRPGAYRARGGGMGQRSGSGRDTGRDKEQKEGESTTGGSGGRWQR